MRSFNPPNLADARAVVYDTETTGVDWKRDRVVGHVLALDGQRAEYYPVRHEGGGNYDPDQVESFLRDAFKRPDLRIIGHAVKFDVHSAKNHDIEIRGPLECTMVNETLIDENMYRYNLDETAPRYGVKKDNTIYEYLAARFGGEPERKVQIGNFWKLSGDDPRAEQYATDDGRATYTVWEKQQPLLDAQNLRAVHDVECRTIRTLYRMERRGVRIDEERLDRVRHILNEKLRIAYTKLPRGEEFNVRAPSQLIEAFTAAGITNWPHTAPSPSRPNGSPSFTEEWLRTTELGMAVVAVRKITNLMNSFLDPLVKEHIWRGRVHTNFHQLRNDDYGTITGRLSSSGPNMQQVPKRDRDLAPLFRSIFLPEIGHLWWAEDWAQCEFRIFADYTGARVLVDGYNAVPPIDIHTIVAQMLTVERDPTAKRLNLGMLYGMGVKKLGNKLSCEEDRARQLRGQWDRAIPEARGFLREAEWWARKRGWVRTKLHRRARLPFVFAHKAGSRIIQGTNADMVKLKAAEIDEMFAREGDDVGALLLSVHDELCLSVAEDRPDLAKQANAMMQNFGPDQPISFSVPMAVDQHSGRTWAEAAFPNKQNQDKAADIEPFDDEFENPEAAFHG